MFLVVVSRVDFPAVGAQGQVICRIQKSPTLQIYNHIILVDLYNSISSSHLFLLQHLRSGKTDFPSLHPSSCVWIVGFLQHPNGVDRNFRWGLLLPPFSHEIIFIVLDERSFFCSLLYEILFVYPIVGQLQLQFVCWCFLVNLQL